MDKPNISVEVVYALAERQKGYRDNRPPADKAKDQARVDAAYVRRSKAVVRYNAAVAHYKKVDARYGDISKARAAYLRYRGHVAFFRFSYYELFEDQLRPFEITDPTGHVNCIFPSQRTITDGEYPLARQLLITTTTRSLQRAEVRDFLQHYLRQAQTLAADSNLVSLSSDTIALEQQWLTGEKQPLLFAPDTQTTASPQPVQSENPAQ